jgi:hypothetical protein
MEQLKAAGVTSAGRYLGWDCEPGFGCIGKNLSSEEADGLLAAGISIFLAFEYAADAAAQGKNQGTKDGQLALLQLSQLGAPPDMAVYFAVDFDIPDYAPHLADTPENAMAKLGPVGLYFQAINDLKYGYEIGVYGGYYAVRRVLDAKLAIKAWQSIAWSGGQLDPRVVLYQTAAGTPVLGADLDIRENGATVMNYGQWMPKTPAPAPAPAPVQPAPSQNGNGMLHLMVTASADATVDWAGKTRTYLYSAYGLPVHIVDEASESEIAKVLPIVVISWAQYLALGGS